MKFWPAATAPRRNHHNHNNSNKNETGSPSMPGVHPRRWVRALSLPLFFFSKIKSFSFFFLFFFLRSTDMSRTLLCRICCIYFFLLLLLIYLQVFICGVFLWLLAVVGRRQLVARRPRKKEKEKEKVQMVIEPSYSHL